MLFAVDNLSIVNQILSLSVSILEQKDGMNKALVPSVLNLLHTILEMGGLDAKLYF